MATTEYRFYQLGRTGLARALMGILAKALERGMRAHIICAAQERMLSLNARLWDEDPNSFLPHSLAQTEGGEGYELDQPILLSVADVTPANGAKLLILTDGADTTRAGAYDLICVMLDGADEAAMATSRGQWAAAKAAGHTLSYWIQNEKGGWEEKIGK